MPLPMDNIIFRFVLMTWPILLAVVATVALIFQFVRHGKFSAEKLQKGLIRQSVLTIVGGMVEPQPKDDETRKWLESRRKIKKYLNDKPKIRNKPEDRVNYGNYITTSLIWTLFWCGAFVFVCIRICLNPLYYGNEAIFLGYFAYYIILGLISFFRR